MANLTDDNPCDTDGAAHAFDLTLERILDASPEKVFKAYTDAAILSQWFAPKPWSITDAVFEPRVGGRFQFTMHGPNGEAFRNTGVFLDVVPNRRIITTDAFGPDWKPTEKAFFSAEILFDDLGNGQTRYTAIARHWNVEDCEAHDKMGFHDGWGQVATQLEEVASKL